jgi:hypothetical protein
LPRIENWWICVYCGCHTFSPFSADFWCPRTPFPNLGSEIAIEGLGDDLCGPDAATLSDDGLRIEHDVDTLTLQIAIKYRCAHRIKASLIFHFRPTNSISVCKFFFSIPVSLEMEGVT